MLHLNIQAVLQARQIKKPYTFLVNAGFSSATASRLINGAGGSLNLRHLTKLCELLYCTPNELLEYRPENKVLPSSHPIYQLEVIKENEPWEEIIKTMPLSQLREITKLKTEEKQ